MLRKEDVHFRKTNKSTVVKKVREVYLRTDIPCQSSQCPLKPPCQWGERFDSTLLSSDADYYLIPDFSVAFRYLDLLEQEELTNLIFTETVLLRLNNEDKTRAHRSLRRITRDSRRSSIVFCNEHCEGATVVREPKETLDHRDWRALNQAASWYRRHLSKAVPIILLSEKFKQEDLPASHDDDGVTVMSLKEYLDTFWPFNMVLHELLDSLKEAILEEDLEEPNQGAATSKKGHGVTGYQEYKPMSELEAGVKSERFFQGILRVRANHRDQAFIRGDANIGEIVIVGNEHRNRAVHGDVVVVELLDRGSWIAPSTHISYNPEEVHAAADDDEELANQHRLREVKPTGRVVGVMSRNWQPYVATLQKGADRDSGSFHMVVPLNPVLPRIRIRHHDPKALADQRIVVRIDSWPCSSVYPNGHYVRTIGPIHELDTEISAILIEHGISVSQTTQGFSAASLKEMPINTPERPWAPDPAELMKRRDMRKHTVFSIDPPNCQDIDDAISIREIENNRIEFGVHIADVSYFVKEGSQTDLEAMSRGTTVYLSDRRFDMLPKVLSEQLCSLRHRADRYAMSVIWTLDSEANIIDTWFGRTVIRSACEMEYEQAQQMLDGMNVILGLDAKLSKQLKPSVILLAKTMRKVRARRVANGALELASSEVKFKFKEKDGGISGIQPKQPLEIHRIIEEAMVMANAAVAKRIYDGFQDSALLRNHPPPIQNHFKMLLVAAESKGFTIDTSSNLALATSLRECAAKSEGDEEFVRLLMAMTTMAMSEASYISSGSRPVNEFTHYGLALEYYTHFTSPIRRYADLVVHRQLLACILRDAPLSPSGALVSSSEGLRNDIKMRQVTDHLNRKNRESKLAQRDSTELFQTLYVLQKTKSQSGNDDDDDDTGEEIPLVETGIIAEIRENGFFVFLPRLGVKGPVYLKISSGDVIVPLSALSGSRPDSSDAGAGNRDHLVKVTGCDLETDHLTRITVRVPEVLMDEHPSALTNTLEFRLFDTVRVALRLRKSYEHRHSIYLRLIGLEQGPTKENTTPAPGHRIGTRLSVESKELDSPSKQSSSETNRISAWSAAPTPTIRREQQPQPQPQPQPQQQQQQQQQQQEPQQGRYQQQQRQRQQQQRQQQRPKTTTKKVIRRKPEELSPEDPYLQTHMDYSLYNLMEWFDRFRIIESDNY